jgi:hypothetical protein
MAGNFTLDSKGIEEIAVGPEVAAVVLAVAEKAKAIAEGLSTDFVVTGDYIDSFEATVEIQELPPAGSSSAHRAAVGVLANTSDHAVAVEYGFKGRSDAPTRKAHRVLGRTIAALGAG